MTIWSIQVPIRSPQGQILEAENQKIKKSKFFETHSNWMKPGNLTKFCPRNSKMLSVWTQNGSRAPMAARIDIFPLFSVYQPTYIHSTVSRPPLTPIFFYCIWNKTFVSIIWQKNLEWGTLRHPSFLGSKLKKIEKFQKNDLKNFVFQLESIFPTESNML